jgi:ABC-type glycerol-3-phosphate transport system substrate-binding protein
MKRILALAAIALLCTACAGGTTPSSSASGITMYGTIDQGITVHN